MTFLAHNEFDVENLVVFGNDSASAMSGINDGVYIELKKGIPTIILIKCACHFLPLAMSYVTSECLPRTFLFAESHNWFSNSITRQQKYCSLYMAINDNTTPQKISAQGQTRFKVQ